ncbi:OsmC family protein [Domibacillus sp. PGB-M46]|uniref:OsmC family protein n=1 Tax=Domibacillus sp. PGB-M46 TaxID=2910255 RepID=UPI001F5815C9|nr:OsmC family protein [Domibacillus sp. PGB-M46]MCI2256480.1 OsmC family protein [Domibacillus sp. PGB-M46]
MDSLKTNLKIVWNGNTKGAGRVKAAHLETNIAIPESLGGSGEGTEPKELLVTSAAACYSMTLVAMLETRKLPVAGLTMDSEATNSKEEGFKIIHYPHVILSANATEEQVQSANRTILAADKGCAIGNMLKKADVQIDLEGKVSVASGEENQ